MMLHILQASPPPPPPPILALRILKSFRNDGVFFKQVFETVKTYFKPSRGVVCFLFSPQIFHVYGIDHHHHHHHHHHYNQGISCGRDWSWMDSLVFPENDLDVPILKWRTCCLRLILPPTVMILTIPRLLGVLRPPHKKNIQ